MGGMMQHTSQVKTNKHREALSAAHKTEGKDMGAFRISENATKSGVGHGTCNMQTMQKQSKILQQHDQPPSSHDKTPCTSATSNNR